MEIQTYVWQGTPWPFPIRKNLNFGEFALFLYLTPYLHGSYFKYKHLLRPGSNIFQYISNWLIFLLNIRWGVDWCYAFNHTGETVQSSWRGDHLSTLMQISKSANIFVFIWKQYVEHFTLKHFIFSVIHTWNMWKDCLQTFRSK